MKRILVILLASLILFAFIACDDNTPVPPVEEKPDTPVNPDTPTPEPVVEDGSEAHPFRIETWSELKNIASLKSDGATTYVMIMNDINVPAGEYVVAISNMVISGANGGVTLTVSEGESCGYLFELVDDVTIRDITYVMKSEAKTFIRSAFGDVTLDDIVLEGSITVTSNNTSGFVTYGNWHPSGYDADENCDITFINCVNKADFNDVVGNCYGAPFISFTMNNGAYKTNLIFDGCANEGNLFYGQWASILIGNANGNNLPDSVIVCNGFTNAGKVGSFKKTAFCSHNDTVENAVEYVDYGKVDLGSNAYLRATSGLSFAADGWNVEDSSTSDSKVVDVQLLGRLYVGYYNESGREIMHAANYTFPIASSIQKSGSTFTMSVPESLQVIGSVAYNGEAEECSIVTYQDNKYWYVGPSAEGLESRPGNLASGIAEFTRYYLAGYDADGNAIVMVELTPENLPQN